MPKAELGYEPDYARPPGATLRDTLAALGMTQSDLAQRSGLSLKHVNQVAQGIAPLTHETALLLEKVTRVPSRFWNVLEANYRDRLARAEDRQTLVTDAEWLRELPVQELVRRGKLPRTIDRGVLLQAVCQFFGVANREAWDRVWKQPLASFRKSPSFESKAGALAAWLRLGELEAESIDCEPFDAKRFRDALKRIRALTREADPARFQGELVALCASCGVAVVFVPEIKGTVSSGAARWLTPSKALIQLSLRHKTDDHLWFSFFHEAGHILLHGKKETFITADHSADEVEEEANAFARTWLIPRQHEQELRELTRWDEIERFAETIGISPGIVVGRLQNEDLLDWRTQLNKLKRRYTFREE
jgi:HTH-type transcriptional regulator/antitoxin HigA